MENLTYTHLSQSFELFKGKKVLIIGDIMVDAYIWGSVDRISPEAPVPILNCKKNENRLGGAANVALNIKSLGGEPIICSITGADDTGIIIENLFNEKHQINTKYILKDSSRQTTKKTRLISQSQQIIRIDFEDDSPIHKELEHIFIANCSKAIEEHDVTAVIFEDYDKGVITPKVIQAISSLCKKKEIPTLCDPKHRNFADYSDLTIFKPNFKEFCQGIKRDVKKNNFELLHSLANEYRTKKNFKHMVITLSEYGVLYNGEDNGIIAAQKRDIADVSGAGDTVISVLTMCISEGLPIKIACEVANIAGGMVCEKSGIVSINKQELLSECKKLLQLN